MGADKNISSSGVEHTGSAVVKDNIKSKAIDAKGTMNSYHTSEHVMNGFSSGNEYNTRAELTTPNRLERFTPIPPLDPDYQSQQSRTSATLSRNSNSFITIEDNSAIEREKVRHFSTASDKSNSQLYANNRRATEVINT